jgi:hypothetical protein
MGAKELGRVLRDVSPDSVEVAGDAFQKGGSSDAMGGGSPFSLVCRKGLSRGKPVQLLEEAEAGARICCEIDDPNVLAGAILLPSSIALSASPISPDDKKRSRHFAARRAEPSRELRDFPAPLASKYATSPASRAGICASSSRQRSASQCATATPSSPFAVACQDRM